MQLAVLICVLCLVIRLLYLILWPELIGTLATYWRSETRFDSIAYGVLLASACEIPRGREIVVWLIRPKPCLIATFVLVLSVALRNKFYQGTFKYTLQGLALFPIVAFMVFSKTSASLQRMLNWTPIIWIGRLSYSLYIWHLPVVFLLTGITTRYFSAAYYGWIMIAWSVAFASASYYSIERPFLKLRIKLRS